MKKSIALNNVIPLLALVWLLALHALPGVAHSFLGHAANGCIAVLLLALGEHILLICLLFFVQLGYKLNGLIRIIKMRWLSAYSATSDVANAHNKSPKGLGIAPVFVAVLLIAAGTLSPSDGVDSGRYQSVAEMLSTAMCILASGIGAFLVVMLVQPTRANASVRQVESKLSKAIVPVLEELS